MYYSSPCKVEPPLTKQSGTPHNYGGSVRWAYRRKNRLGVFSAGLGYAYDSTRIEHDKDFGVAIDEVIYFRDPLVSYLRQPNVVPGSIVVTDLSRSRTYLAGRDYAFWSTGGRTALVRLRTGRIDDRQSVLVSYRYYTAARATYRTHQLDLRVQQDFTSGWTPYYAGSMQAQDVTSTDDITVDANNLNRHRLGLTYRNRVWSAGGEIEFNDDSIDPYNALHGNFNWSILSGYPNQLDLRIGASQFWFRRFERRRASLIDLAVDYHRPLNAHIDFNVRTAYRFEYDSIQEITHGVDVLAGFEYNLGLLTVRCDVEYDKLSVADSNDDGVSVWLRVRRDIPNLLGR